MKLGGFVYDETDAGHPITLWERAVATVQSEGKIPDRATCEQEALARATRRYAGLGIVTPATQARAMDEMVGFAMTQAATLLPHLAGKASWIALAFGGAALAGLAGKRIRANPVILGIVTQACYEGGDIEVVPPKGEA